MSKSEPFVLLDVPLRNGSTVRIRPGYNGHERRHVGRYGLICKVICLHNYAEQTYRYLYSVLVGGEEFPYSHGEVEAP